MAICDECGYPIAACNEIGLLEKRIAELEVGLRRAIHLYETMRPIVMWPMNDENATYDDKWAEITIGFVRDALAGKDQT